MNFEIVKLTNEHIKDVVEVHIGAFPEFFLTFLGPKFLSEFYKSFLDDPMGIGFVAQDVETKQVLGAIVGPLVPDGYFKRLIKRRWWAFCIASISAVLKKPTAIKRLFRAVFYRGESPSGSQRALLSSIAVSPETQGMGVGKSLVDNWVEQVKQRQGLGCFLTTDAENNDAINGFYQKLGWQIESTYKTSEGRVMNRYVYDFKE
ncbi:MAG: GNAT family N-acetyltransferase [Planctomycetes bacterium]|nr:GNAT family N-acetyltransferase [Planctomycetota bacterium]